MKSLRYSFWSKILLALLLVVILILSSCATEPVTRIVLITTTVTQPAKTITETLPPETITTMLPQTTITKTLTATSPETIGKEAVSAIFYPSMTIGGFVYGIGYNLTNGSSNTITVIRVEFIDAKGNIQHTVSESTIQAASHKGRLLSGNSFNWSLSFQLPYPAEEIEDWQVIWYCKDFEGDGFIAESSYTKIVP